MKPLLLASLLLASTAFAQRVPFRLETSLIPSTQAGDPTFVFVPRPSTAGIQLIVGTDMAMSGLYFWEPGQPQLPQIVTAFGLVNGADARGSMLLVTSTSGNTVLAFEVSDAGVTPLDTGFLNVPTPRHVALAKNPDGGFEVWVDTSSTTVQHFTMSAVVDGGVTFTALPSITVVEPPTGLAVDDRKRRLYVAQPSFGILTVEPGGTSDFLVSIDAGHLGVGVGGIDLFLAEDGGVLVFSTAPFEGELNVHSHSGNLATFRTTLQIGDTDGGSARVGQPRFVDVFEQPVPGFPKGLLVVQDDLTANYKLVSLADVHAVFPLPPPFIPGGPPAADAGEDGGTDAGTPTDGGVPDGGSGTGGGGGSGRPPGPAPGVEPTPTCGCSGGPFAVLPALLLLWWIRRLRS